LAGLPIVTTNVGSSAEVVIDGVGGVVTSKNPDEIATAIRSLVNVPELRVRYGEAAKSRAESYFEPAAMCERHLEIYRELGKK